MRTAKPIEIFRPGRHTASDGRVIDFTEAQLRAAVAAYDRAIHEAPITVGHPTHNKPAYGWVKGLAFDQSVLAEPDQVEPTFAEMVATGRFKKVSASWYLPDSPANPKPGALYLRHVAFLGAQPPAIKGLKNPEFAEQEQGVVEFTEDFGEDAWTWERVARLFRGIRDFIIGEKGVEVADKVLPAWDVSSVEQAATAKALELEPNQVAYKEQEPPAAEQAPAPPTQATTANGEDSAGADFAERQAELDRREAEVAKREAEARLGGVASFVEGLIAVGKVLPVQKNSMVAFIAALPESCTIEFAEGDGTKSQEAVGWFKDFLATLPRQVEFAEVGGAGDAPINLEDSNALATAIADFVESEHQAGREMSFAQALQHVKRTHNQ